MGLGTTTVPMNVLPQFGLLRTHSTSIRVNNSSAFSFPLLSRRRNNNSSGGFVCFAVDDDLRKKQQNLSNTSTSLGSAIEERPLDMVDSTREESFEQDGERGAIYDFLYPSKELLPDDKEMSLFDHLEELRQRIFISVLAVGASIMGCFAFSKELIMILEAPVKSEGVRFLQLAPGEFFFTTLKISRSIFHFDRFRGGMLEARGIAPSEKGKLTFGDIDRARGREVVPHHFLVECATGYALFLANDISDIDMIKYQAAEEYINRPVTPFVLKDYVPFTSHDDALIQMNSIFKSNVTDKLIEFLKKNFEPPFNHRVLVTADPKLGHMILKKLGLCNIGGSLPKLVMRALRERIDEFIKLPHGDLDKAQRHLTRLYKDQMRTKLDIKSPVSSFLQEHVTVVPQFEGFFNVKGEKNLLCTKNLVPGEALYGEELIRVQNEVGTEVEYRVCDPCRSKLGAAILGGVTNIWIKPGSRVIYIGNVSGLTVSDLSDLVGQDGFVYVVGLSDDVAHMAGKRQNVVTFTESYSYTRYRMLLSTVDVVFGEIDHLHNKFSIEAGDIACHAEFYLKAGGHYMICTKGNNMNSMGHDIFYGLSTEREFKLIQTVTLDLVEGAYALNIGGYRMSDE